MLTIEEEMRPDFIALKRDIEMVLEDQENEEMEEFG